MRICLVSWREGTVVMEGKRVSSSSLDDSRQQRADEAN
jgi:hypothetical protein